MINITINLHSILVLYTYCRRLIVGVVGDDDCLFNRLFLPALLGAAHLIAAVRPLRAAAHTRHIVFSAPAAASGERQCIASEMQPRMLCCSGPPYLLC